MPKKGIPADAIRRGNPEEIRYWMGLADGKNVSTNELPDTTTQRLPKDGARGGKRHRKNFTTG